MRTPACVMLLLDTSIQDVRGNDAILRNLYLWLHSVMDRLFDQFSSGLPGLFLF